MAAALLLTACSSGTTYIIEREDPAFADGAYHPLWRAYGLTEIPNHFLIDNSNGQIIAQNLRGDDLSGKPAELLN